jgi:hypothetical protein
MASLGYALPVLAGKTEQRKHFSAVVTNDPDSNSHPLCPLFWSLVLLLKA